MYILGEKSREKLKGVHPQLVKLMTEAVKESPYDFRIVEGVRTAAYQNSLYQQGRTVFFDKEGNPLKKVTKCDGYKYISNHQAKADGYGHAIDIFVCGIVENGHYRKFTTAEGYDNKKMFAVVKHIKEVAQKLGIPVKWGGDWKKDKDYPHFEI